MVDIRASKLGVKLETKLRAKFTRRHSGIGSLSTQSSTGSRDGPNVEFRPEQSSLISSEHSLETRKPHGQTAHSAGANHKTSGSASVVERSSVSQNSSSNRDEKDGRHWSVLTSGSQQEHLFNGTLASAATAKTEPAVEGEEPAVFVVEANNAGSALGLEKSRQASDMNGNDPQASTSTQRSSINEQSAAAAAAAINKSSAIGTSATAGTDGRVSADAAVQSSANDSSSTTDDDDALLAQKSHASNIVDATIPRLVSVIPATPTPPATAATPPRPTSSPRRLSLLSNRQSTLIRTLVTPDPVEGAGPATHERLLPSQATMVTRKIWVKRPGASATLVTINEDDLVDDVRDMILRKYGNSLGRQFDAPDITLRIVPREKRVERMLGPEEPMSRTLDAYYPGGQSVDEALIIDVPLGRRTPRASPRAGPPHATHLTSAYYDEVRPSDAATDYFGPSVTPAMPVTVTAPTASGHAPHTISVLNTGQIPQIPSPGGTRSRNYRERPDRPRLGRTHTSSPTIIGLGGHPASLAGPTASHSMHDQAGGPPPAPPPMPTPPAATDISSTIPSMVPIQRTSTPPPRQASPRPLGQPQSQAPATSSSARPRKKKTATATEPLPGPLPNGILNNGVPPINVLIVEDNIINLKLLEAFVKRLKVRWQTAMNGREAVNKWRAGGFHLVLMDIQLPIMSGLEATREIRRLERVNSIGVFSGSAGDAVAAAGKTEPKADVNEDDKLTNLEVFKSPVIIVALTASSLQSDRHEALAAGCNDFLTKPVNFVWLERKVMEWGCMQALIDYDGWRKWKDFAHTKEEAEVPKKSSKPKKTKNRLSITAPA